MLGGRTGRRPPRSEFLSTELNAGSTLEPTPIPMNATLTGTVMQTVLIELAPGESVYCQTHAMAWMTDNVRMDTNTGGGLLSGLKRSLSGGSFFMTTYTANGPGV